MQKDKKAKRQKDNNTQILLDNKTKRQKIQQKTTATTKPKKGPKIQKRQQKKGPHALRRS